MWCMLISISSIICGPLSVHTVSSKSGWLSFTVLRYSVATRNRGGERWQWRGMGGGAGRWLNMETGVWQGTVIRFINQPMLFSLLGGCCKTLSVNWRSPCPTTETLLPPSSSLRCPPLPHPLPSLSLFPRIPLYLCLASSSSLSSLPLGAIRFSSSYPTKMDWPWKHPFCFHHHACIFSSPGRGVSSSPPSSVSIDHWLAHNSQYFLQLEWNWAY